MGWRTMTGLDLLLEKLSRQAVTQFEELDKLNVWSYKDLEYVAKLHKFQPNKINRLQFLVGQFFMATSQGVPCFRCDGYLEPENINFTTDHFHHIECEKSSRTKIYAMRSR